MSGLRSNAPVIALAVSDVHLQTSPPIARAEEPNWFEAMERPWREIKKLQEEWSGCPILVAGDIFDRYSNPPELVNWSIDFLPVLYCIPGNHDLPYHAPALAHKSSFGTLARAGRFIPLGRKPLYVRELALYGTTLGKHPPRPVVQKGGSGLCLHVVLCHEYVWKDGCGYQGALDEQRAGRVGRKVKGFDLAIFGDNHIPFQYRTKGGTLIYNCGGLYRRKSNEAKHRPQVGLIHRDGIVTPHYLDCSQDVMTELVHDELTSESKIGQVKEFLTELQETTQMTGSVLDFRDAVKKIKCRNSVRKVLLTAIGDGNEIG